MCVSSRLLRLFSTRAGLSSLQDILGPPASHPGFSTSSRYTPPEMVLNWVRVPLNVGGGSTATLSLRASSATCRLRAGCNSPVVPLSPLPSPQHWWGSVARPNDSLYCSTGFDRELLLLHPLDQLSPHASSVLSASRRQPCTAKTKSITSAPTDQ